MSTTRQLKVTSKNTKNMLPLSSIEQDTIPCQQLFGAFPADGLCGTHRKGCGPFGIGLEGTSFKKTSQHCIGVWTSRQCTAYTGSCDSECSSLHRTGLMKQWNVCWHPIFLALYTHLP